LRELRKITEVELAESCELEPAEIFAIEAGRPPSFDVLEKLCDGLGLTLVRLFECYQTFLEPVLGRDEPNNVIVELSNPEVRTRPSPTFREARVLRALLSVLGDLRGWELAMLPELQLRNDVLVPALAGWRLEPGLELGEGPHCKVRPSWVCELASHPSRLRMARDAYARHRVEHLWLLDLDARQLEILKRRRHRWVTVDRQRERLGGAPPFAGVQLELGKVWV